MTQFNYTHEFEDCVNFSSYSVDSIWYDEPTSTVFIEWADSYNVYRYNGVPLSVVEAAVDADSVGSAVSKTIKQVYGPGTNLGDDAKPVKRDETSTREFSLQPPAVVNNYVSTDTSGRFSNALPATTEYSLQTPQAKKSGGLSLAEGEPVYTLYFEQDGEEKSHVLRSADNWEAAIENLNEFAEAFGLDISVYKVVIEFE